MPIASSLLNKPRLVEKLREFYKYVQKNINQINDLKNFINKKCQTVSYFGFTKKQLELFILNNNLLGVDRLVPIGKALGIDVIWDGYEVLKSLSRSVSLE